MILPISLSGFMEVPKCILIGQSRQGYSDKVVQCLKYRRICASELLSDDFMKLVISLFASSASCPLSEGYWVPMCC